MRLIALLMAFLISSATMVHSRDLNATKVREGDAPSEGLKLNTHTSSGSNLDIYDLELIQDSKNSSIMIDAEYDYSEGLKPEDKSRRSTVFWGGIFPFIAIPNAQDDRDNPGFLSKDSVSFFWFFKKKF